MKNWTIITLITLGALFNNCNTASAQPAVAGILTVGVLIEQVKEVIKSLENTVTTMEGNTSKLVDGTTSQLNGLIDQLKNAVHDDLSTPINTLSGSALEAAARLQFCVDDLKDFINTDIYCVMLHKEEFLAAVQTVGMRVADKLPFSKSSNPLVYSFRFDGHVANIIPKDGGRAILSGYKLYANESPNIIFWDTARKIKYAEMAGEKSGGEDSISILVPSNLIAAHMGENIQIEVQVKKKHLLSTAIVADLFMPFVVPKAYSTGIQINGYIGYDVAGKATKALPAYTYHFSNASCQERLAINSAKYTYAGLPPGSRIVSIEDKDDGGREKSQIQVSFTDDSLTASGWLDVANCLTIHLGLITTYKMCDKAAWNHTITPILEYLTTQSKVGQQQSDPIKIDETSNSVNLLFDKEQSEKCTFWYELTAFQGGVPVKIFTSPRRTTLTSISAEGLDQAGEYTLNSLFNPTLVQGKCSLNINVRSARCAF